MAKKEFRYNCRIWQPYPTTNGEDNFFHAVFGQGLPCFDSDSDFRRKCLLNLVIYMKEIDEFKEFLMAILGVHEEEMKEHYATHYETYIKYLQSSKHTVSIHEIPYISALQKIRLVVFVGDNTTPNIYHPQEELLAKYPWKTKDELKEVVVHFNNNIYTRLQFNRYEDSLELPLKELSLTEEEETEKRKDDSFYKQTYPKLSGSGGIRGVLYQIDLLTIFLLNATDKIDSFRLSTENKTAGKFDDVVLETKSKGAILLQAKTGKNKSVNYDNLFTSNDSDFSLPRYYFSYQEFKENFNVDVLYLCTNMSSPMYKSPLVSKRNLEQQDPLYVQGQDNSYLRFNENAVNEFRANAEEYRTKFLPDYENVLDDDHIEKFLSKFRLVTKYPARGDLGTVIEQILHARRLCDHLQTKNCAKYLNGKMLDWYDNPKGRYLNQNTLRIFLAEFRSKTFCEKLCNFNIHLTGRHISYPREKRLVRIRFSGSYLLSVVKVYYNLYAKKKKYLFISPAETGEAQIEMVKAFEDPGYEILVGCFKAPDAMSEEMARRLADIIDKFSYKKIILITEDDGKVGLLKEKNEEEYEEVFEDITFNELTIDSQRRLLRSVTHFFEAK